MRKTSISIWQSSSFEILPWTRTLRQVGFWLIIVCFQFSERSTLALKIFERHFAANSTEPVNVDNSTSKRIRHTMKEKVYPHWTFDIAQYQVHLGYRFFFNWNFQIFHLLKYDCWPRFLRAGGQQPEFTDDELAEEDERIARLELLGKLFQEHFKDFKYFRRHDRSSNSESSRWLG